MYSLPIGLFNFSRLEVSQCLKKRRENSREWEKAVVLSIDFKLPKRKAGQDKG